MATPNHHRDNVANEIKEGNAKRPMKLPESTHKKGQLTFKEKPIYAVYNQNKTESVRKFVTINGATSKVVVLKYLKDTANKDFRHPFDINQNQNQHNSRMINHQNRIAAQSRENNGMDLWIKSHVRQIPTRRKQNVPLSISHFSENSGHYASPTVSIQGHHRHHRHHHNRHHHHHHHQIQTNYPGLKTIHSPQAYKRASLLRLPNFAESLKNSGYVFGRILGTKRRYSESLQKLKARLRKSRSHGDFGPGKRLFMPLVRFRKAIRLIILLLRAIYTTKERIERQEKERKLSVDISDPLMFSKRAYETYGISFDPEDFKANRQIQVTLEAKNILTMEPRQRTSPQVHAVLVSLRQAVPEFSEFPITMQQSLAKVGHYERFTAKRIIIRQGHLADNFYFILSGTAVVTLLETDKVTGEQKARIATTLGRGKSFGELALMHKARRSATVTCRDDVELLSVGREDFVDIFMHVDRGVEPEHIRFLRVLPMLRGWPVHVLPHDNPKILLFTYVRRGVVLCRDSNNSDWIFVIKSGSCRIIKALPNLAPAGKDTSSTSSTTSLSKLTNMTSPNLRSKHTGPLASIEEETATSDEEDSSMYSDEFDSREARLLGRKKESNVFGSNTDEQEDKKMGLQYVQSLDGITYNKNNYGDSEKSLKDDSSNEDSPRNCIFVQVLKLGPKDIFGLESSVFSNMKKTVSTSLVSDGAEMIMINRKFFMENTSSDLRNCMRKEIHPLPTEESLQNQLQNRVEWESYRTLTLQKTMAEMNLIDTHRR